MEGRDDQEGEPQQDDEGDESPQPTTATRLLLVERSGAGPATPRRPLPARVVLSGWSTLARRTTLTLRTLGTLGGGRSPRGRSRCCLAGCAPGRLGCRASDSGGASGSGGARAACWAAAPGVDGVDVVLELVIATRTTWTTRLRDRPDVVTTRRAFRHELHTPLALPAEAKAARHTRSVFSLRDDRGDE